MAEALRASKTPQ